MDSKLQAFALQQSPFHRQAATKTADRAVTSDDAMARDDHRNRVGTTGGADCARGPGLANLLCDPTVRARLTVRYCRQDTPHFLLKACSRRQVNRKLPTNGFTGGISLQLALQVVRQAYHAILFGPRSGSRHPTKLQASKSAG